MSDVTGMPKCAQQKSQGWTTFTPAVRPLLQVRHGRSSIAEVNSHYKQSTIEAVKLTAASAAVSLTASLLPCFKAVCAFRGVNAYSCYIFTIYIECTVGRVAQSVLLLTTGWTVRDRIPVDTRFSARPDRP